MSSYFRYTLSTFKGVIFIIAMIFSINGYGQSQNHSAGLRLGTFFAGSYKVELSEPSAIEGIAGFKQESGKTHLLIGVYYTRDIPLTWDSNFDLYYGGGISAFLGDGSFIPAPTIVVGTDYKLNEEPFMFFIDLMPMFHLAKGDTFHLEASLGARYLF